MPVIDPRPVCPACLGALSDADFAGGRESFACGPCRRRYPAVAGLPDLRLAPDRYLALDAERAKAERLAAVAREPGADVGRVASAYYAITDDVVDRRRDRFLRHIAAAEARGRALADRLPAEGRILEVGCGTGGLLAAASKPGRTLVGVDVASRWLVVARRRLDDRRQSVPLVAAGADRLPWPDGSFDAVVADSLLEHLDDPSAALREWRRVLRPGGTLDLWSPNRFTLGTDPHLGLWGLGWLPRAALPGYLRLRGRSEWPPPTLSPFAARRLVAAGGFEDPRVTPPAPPPAWLRTRPRAEQVTARLYNAARRVPGVRALVLAVGPVWELRAVAPRRSPARGVA